MSAIQVDPHSREYLHQLLQAEAALAEARGHYKVRLPGIESMTRLTPLYPTRRDATGAFSSQALPRWRREWHDGGKLIGECGLSLAYGDFGMTAFTTDRKHSGIAKWSDHPHKDAAILAAIVEAATSYFTAERAARQDNNRSIA
jgi:hypothetical protein